MTAPNPPNLFDSVGHIMPTYQAADPDTRLYLGDCREVLSRLPERGSIDLIFADPPFNWDVQYGDWNDDMPRGGV